MKTENLDAEIARLELEDKHNLLDKMQKSKLSEFKAIKQALSEKKQLIIANAGNNEESVCPNCDGEGFSGKGTKLFINPFK